VFTTQPACDQSTGKQIPLCTNSSLTYVHNSQIWNQDERSYRVKPSLVVLLDKKVCRTKTTGFGHPCKSNS